MDALLTTILLHIEDDLKHDRVIDVKAVVRNVHPDFPYLSLHDISDQVFRTVVLKGGDFQWDAAGSTERPSLNP